MTFSAVTLLKVFDPNNIGTICKITVILCTTFSEHFCKLIVSALFLNYFFKSIHHILDYILFVLIVVIGRNVSNQALWKWHTVMQSDH